MKVFGQIVYETGSMACPYPDDYQQWDSIKEARDSLARCHDDPMGFDDEGVTLLLWKGEPEPDDIAPCDSSACPPDMIFELGPRGGTRPAV